MANLDQILDYQADRAEAGNWWRYYGSKACSANVQTTVQTINLPAGTYLIVSFMDLSAAVSTYNHMLPDTGGTVRSPGAGGGGSINVTVISSDQPQVVKVDTYVSGACTVRSTVRVIKLSDTPTNQN